MSSHASHRHSAPGQHEHEFEPQYGLPEPLPAGERLLWQGSPCWRRLAIERFHVRKVAVYFGVLLAARVAALISEGLPPGAALLGCMALSLISALALGLLAFMAWMAAQTAVYTVTDRRVVMRIGIVLTITLNLPLSRISGAALAPHPHGSGDIALRLRGPDRIAYGHLWPHARPWHVREPEPTLLCVPDAARVADVLCGAWRAAQGETGAAAAGAVAAPGAGPLGRVPTLATR